MSGRGDRRVLVVSTVVPEPPVGGGHKRTLRLLEAIEAAGGRPHLVTDDQGSPAGAALLRERGWAVDVVPPTRVTARSRALQHVRRLPSPYLHSVAARVAEIVREGCAFAQVEHTQNAYYRRALGATPWVLSLHNVDSELVRTLVDSRARLSFGRLRAWNRWQAMRSVERRALRQADAVLCVSGRDREQLEESGAPVLVVPNGVDADLFLVEDALPDDERVLFFGQFEYPPNRLGIVRFLREGWPHLAAARPGARLRLAGAGLDSELRDLAERSERVEAVGLVPSIADELRSTRLVIVPIWQGGGTRLKVLESMAAGRPVVGTPLGVEGIGFEDGRHGLVAEAPAGLARAGASLLADEARSEALAREGRRLAGDFSWDRTTEPASELYARWLARPSTVA